VLLCAWLIKTKDFFNKLYCKRLIALAAVAGRPKSSAPHRRESYAAPAKIVAFLPAWGSYSKGQQIEGTHGR
jgi:hypothetical protein